MIQITIYDPATGEVLKVVSGTNEADVLANVKQGQAYIIGPTDGSEHWINPETQRRRKLQALKPGTRDNLIYGLPAGAVATIKGETFIADASGEIAVSAGLGLPEAVRVEIRAPTYAPAVITLPLSPEGSGAPVAQHFDQVRKDEYRRAGITIEALVVALIEDREGDPTALDALIAKRRDVRARTPKNHNR